MVYKARLAALAINVSNEYIDKGRVDEKRANLVTCRHMNRFFDHEHQVLVYVEDFRLELKIRMKNSSFLFYVET